LTAYCRFRRGDLALHCAAALACADESRNVQLSYSDDGIHFDLHVRIPRFRELLRISKMWLVGLTNALRYRCALSHAD
jgi:hypothetical protein